MSRHTWVSALLSIGLFAGPIAAAGAPERLLHLGPWIGIVAAFLGFVTEPPLPPGQMIRDPQDRRSALAIVTGLSATQVAAALEFALRSELRPAPFGPVVLTGALVTAAGFAYRYWAIRTLGRFFTSMVRVAEGQRVVDTGPYRLVRHPSYTGTLVMSLGVAIGLASVAGAVLTLAFGIPAYLYRIRVEEAALIAGLGDEYREYRRRTWRLVPFVL